MPVDLLEQRIAPLDGCHGSWMGGTWVLLPRGLVERTRATRRRRSGHMPKIIAHLAHAAGAGTCPHPGCCRDRDHEPPDRHGHVRARTVVLLLAMLPCGAGAGHGNMAVGDRCGRLVSTGGDGRTGPGGYELTGALRLRMRAGHVTYEPWREREREGTVPRARDESQHARI
jgi:hypothetical protein